MTDELADFQFSVHFFSEDVKPQSNFTAMNFHVISEILIGCSKESLADI